MESVYHIVTIRVNETSWAHIWRLRSRYLGTRYDRYAACLQFTAEIDKCSTNIAEYEALPLGHYKLRAMGVWSYILKIDAKVIASQIENESMASDATLER
jgi:ribonuclease HI